MTLWLLTILLSSVGAWISTVDPGTVLPTVQRSGDAAPRSERLSTLAGAFPTNEWWTSIVIGDGAAVFNNPYTVLAATDGVVATVPSQQVVGDIWQDVADTTVEVVKLGSAGATDWTVASYDDLSVTLAFDDFTTPLVRGSPYLSALYTNGAPTVTAPQQLRDLVVDGATSSCNGTLRSVAEASLSFTQSDSSWLLFADPPLDLACSGDTSTTVLKASSSSGYSGVLRLAMLTNCTTGQSAKHCTNPGVGEPKAAWGELLRRSAARVVTGGAVSYESGVLSFSFAAQGGEVGGEEVLHLGLPHHYAYLNGSAGRLATEDEWAAGHRSIRGWSRPIIGDTWEMTLPALSPSSPFLAHTKPLSDPSVDPSWRESVRKALLEGLGGDEPDAAYDPPENYQIGAGDTYFSGKMLARMARVALVAEELGETKTAVAVASRLQGYLDVWLNASRSRNPLLYDVSWGGVVACGCNFDGDQGPPRCLNAGPSEGDCPALTNAGMNFGAGFYNDHHFHYGYFLFAAATCAHFDAEWALRSPTKDALLLLVRDFANPSADDKYFPRARHKDWFFGASWASGITNPPNPNGRNQESTSEAVNGYFALELYGAALEEAGDTTGLGAALRSQSKCMHFMHSTTE